MQINLPLLRQQIDALMLEYPQLADDEQLRVDTIEGETELFDLLGTILQDILAAKAMQTAIGERIKDLNARKERFGWREDACRKLAHRLMDLAHLRKVQLTEATFSVRASPARCIITDESSLPDKFMRIKKEPNLAVIKDALKTGVDVKGATLSNQPDTIAILTK